MTRQSFGRLLGSAALLMGSACTDLEVTNPNNPDIGRALATPEDVQNLAISSVNSWYLNSTYLEPYMMTEVTADVLTANFGNFGMRFNNLEPRIPYENNSAGNDRTATEAPWEGNYAGLGAANDALRAFAGGIELDTPEETDAFVSLARFSQAASLTNLALLFDQAFPLDEASDPAAPPDLVDYTAMTTFALEKWDLLITELSGQAYTYDATVLPLTSGPLSSDGLSRIAHTMAARTLMLSPRTGTENAAVDWARVLQYAEKGISGPQGAGSPLDVTVVGDGNVWYSYINFYGNEHTWLRVDQRVINMMDPTVPAKYNGTIVAPAAVQADNRMNTDFTFHNAVRGDPSRGIYMQSPFSHSRYIFHARNSATSAEGPVPYLMRAENDLIIAEALVRTGGDLARAASLINITRVGRGGLLPATAADGPTVLLDKIYYERVIELLNSNALGLFDGRRLEKLQPGTFRHLPIPAKELETLVLSIYTFGGVGKPDMNVMLSTGVEVGLHFPDKRPAPRRKMVAPQK
jgi:starch-binding outer membrane protein, SusD/RagB family